MAGERPLVIVRLGSHAEKDYVLKLAPFIDGVIVGANLFEATPGATASLLLRTGGKARVYLDPMTYAFGAYEDPTTRRVRTDLDWIKSDQTRKEGRGKKTVREFKRSYRLLAEALGWPLSDAVSKSRAVNADVFKDPLKTATFCKRVIDYQLERISREFTDEEELKDFADQVPEPSAVFAPYFYIEPSNTGAWLDANLALARSSKGLGADVPVHAVVCADVAHLKDAAFSARLLSELPAAGIAGVWLWFSGFFEEAASLEDLVAYRRLVVGLANHVEVYAMHGGFLSLALNKYGMRGVSHGVGYGEQKDVVPVIGQSTPTVRYYLPPLARRLGVLEIERSFGALGVKTPKDFHEKVCGCAVCKGVVQGSIAQFAAFGEMHRSRASAKRSAQTPAAAKRCRFHFLLSRITERDDLHKLSLGDLVKRLDDARDTWGKQPTLSRFSEHLARWSAVLTQK